MKTQPQIPSDAEKYAETQLFTDVSVPKRLTSKHNTRAGVWGKICVLAGSLRYIVEGSAQISQTLTPTRHGIIVPEQDHYVQMIGPVEFKIAFFQCHKEDL